MADEHISNASVREDTEATTITKNESITTVTNENGYESECSSSSRSEVDIARSALEVEVDAFTRFIERQRVEVMFELRHLRLGERPVTGQSNRARIENFLHNIQEQGTRSPSARPVVASAHIADINALANSRCVSAALGSAAFRQDLENVVRRSFETRPVPVRPTQSIPPAPPIPSTLTPINTEQQHSQMTEALPLHTAPIRNHQERFQITQTPSHEPFNIARQERELRTWQTITQLQREIIVVEISDLVHRQLVTSALESDFRTHLEQNVFTRLQRGAPTQLDQQQQQSTPIAVTPRVPPMPTAVRTTPNTALSTSTSNELSSRLDSMQHMLQLMFSMQMDMQRTLRQEVASSIANHSLTTTISSSHPMDAGHCTVCLTAVADTVLYRCGHLCVCYMCGLNLRVTTSNNGMKCPICRAPVDDILRVYRSSRDEESM